MKKTLFGAVAIAAMLITACGGGDDPTPIDCTGSTPTYTANVKAIFDTNCAFGGCHDSVTKEQGYDYSTYLAAKSVATSKKSELIGSINHSSGSEKMPKGAAKLSAADIKTISCWVENGTPQ